MMVKVYEHQVYQPQPAVADATLPRAPYTAIMDVWSSMARGLLVGRRRDARRTDSGRNMSRTSRYAFAALACTLLASCGSKEPTGQVVATLDGKEITALDLKAEMGGFTAPDAASRKRAEQAALEAILSRKAVAEAARKAGIEKTPEFAQQQTKMSELLLIQSYQNQLARQVPDPSRIEIDKYIADHPELYAERKIFTVDQIRFPGPATKELIEALTPLRSLEDVAAYLRQRSIAFQRGGDRIDALRAGPQIVQQILKLPPDEAFVIPVGNLMTVNHLVGSQTAPVTGAAAVAHATQTIKAQRMQESVSRQFQSVVKASRADIVYNKAYKPAAPATKGPAAKAPAPQAPAAKAP
jgi:EpsD family peptidyl-prolyl cis-trans isomerase